jgi:hypothetical protein
MNKKISAKTAGWSLITMAVVAGFSFGYTYPMFYIPDQLDSTKNTLIQNIGLYQYMLIGMIIVAILDLIVSYALYIFFREQNKNISSISAILRIIYTIMLGFALYYLVKNIYPSELTNT